MESEAASPAPPLSPTPATPAPPSAAPPFSPGGGDAGVASSPFSSSLEQELFPSEGEEPELGAGPKRPLVPVADAVAVPEEKLGGPAESEDSLPGTDCEQAVLPDAAMPKARLSEEDDGLAQEVLDDGLAGGADGYSSPSQVIGVVPPPPHGEMVGTPGLVVEGAGSPEEKGDDDDEKPDDEKSSARAMRASSGKPYPEQKPDDGVLGAEEEKALEDGPASEGSSGEEVNNGGTLHEHLVVDGAPPADSSGPMGSGDGAAAVLEDELVQDPAKGKHADDLCAGNEQETVSGSAVIGSPEAVSLQSSFGVIKGAVGNEIFDGESKEEPLSSKTGEEKGSIAEVAVEILPDDAELEVNMEENGAGRGAGDNLDTICTVTNGTQEYEAPEMKEHIGYTKEEMASNSSEPKGCINGIEKAETQKVATVSVDSGDVQHSAQKPNQLGSSGIVDNSFPVEPEGEGSEFEPASANKLQENSENAKPNIDADEGDLSSAREVGVPSSFSQDVNSEQQGSHASMLLDVAHFENDPVTSSADSNQKGSDDGSEAADDIKYLDFDEESEEDGTVTDGSDNIATCRSSEATKLILKQLVEGSVGPSSRFGNSGDYSDEIDGLIVSDSDEEAASDDEEDGKELFNSAALTALLKAATGASSDNGITSTSQDATRIFSADQPAGLGSSVPSLKPTPPRMNRMNIFSPSDLAVVEEPENNLDEKEKKLQEKVDEIRVKFLRLLYRLGHSPEDRVASQVLYRLGLAEGIRRARQIGRAFSLENAKKKALQLEEEGKEPLDFSCNILVLGKTGVGKSATINSIFGEEKVHTNAFDPATTSIKEIVGTVDGVKVRVIDTPGLRSSVMDQTANQRILASIKKYTKKCPPDIVLYVDRLDTQTWDFNDLPLLRSIASTMGSSIWFNAIVALTHAASAPPDGPTGSPLSYEVFVDQRSRVVQHAIRHAAGDMRLMNPVALVENHPSCRRNREGQRVLPNGLSWRTQMLLLCYSSKILSEANSVLKLQDPSPGKLFGFRVRSPPLPFLLSSLLQSRAHPKLAADQGVDTDIEMGDLSDSDQEQEEDEYDQLPPFKPLRKAQIAKLTKEQRKAYFDEYDYRVKLLQKKQWKEELRRSKEMKRGKAGQDESSYGDMADDYDQDAAPAAIPVPLPDMVLPPSFDCDNPAYRYRFLEPTSQLLVRPVLDSHGWDHDCGYDGVSVEENLALASKFPAGISVQITKDKKEFNIHLDSSISARHGETGSTLAGFDIQSVGKQLAYIIRSETKFKNLKKNKTAAGISVTFLGENIATGLKVEDQLLIGKRLGLVASTGAVRAQGDMAYGANLEMRLRDKDFPIGQNLSTLGLSLMRWRRDLALGINLQSQFSIARNSKMAVRVGLNNKRSGQITVRTSTSDQIQIALLGILPVAVSIYRSIWSGEAN